MNDSLDRNLVVIIFVVSIAYLNYLSLQIRSKSGWSNVTCNPISLFSNSIFQTEEDANKDFERCIVSLSAATTTQMFKKQQSEQEKVVTKLSGIKKEYDKLSSHVDKYTNEVTNVVDDYNEKIEGVKHSQGNANKLNETTTKKVDSYLLSIQEIFKNITNYFNI